MMITTMTPAAISVVLLPPVDVEEVVELELTCDEDVEVLVVEDADDVGEVELVVVPVADVVGGADVVLDVTDEP